MPFKTPVPIIAVSISLKRRDLHKQKLRTIRLTLIVLFSAVFIARAEEVSFESGPQRVHLIELFTSQGCSSCPPAEAWMSKLKDDPRLWKGFVPLAFHVDYWDRLGWRDPFASKEWTARQNQYSERWRRDSVYTPGFVLDGREWVDRSIPSASTARLAFLKLSVTNRTVIGEFVPADNGPPDVDLHVVTLGFDLKTRPTAGENGGRNLKQDFVVLSLTSQRMSAGKIEFAFNPDSRAGAIAAWVTSPNQIEPIQAVGGWLKQAP